jgi:hypothetical protein
MTSARVLKRVFLHQEKPAMIDVDMPALERVIALALLLLAAVAIAPAEGFRAGVAKVDITPPAGEKMWGYFDRKGPAEGVLDPLFARILALEAGQNRLALVTLDLGRTFGPASLERLRAAAGRSGVASVLVTASHTHSGPVIQDDYKGQPPAWEQAAIAHIAQAIDEAYAHLADIRLGTGSGVAYIGHNRLRLQPDGHMGWLERNTTRVPTSPVDPTVSVLRIDRSDGTPLAILFNHACHPVVFGSDNLRYSADFPGVAAKAVQDAFGGQPLAFFLQGAPGDINPYYAVTKLDEDAVKMRDWTGQRLGEEVARIARSIQTVAPAQPSIQYAVDTMTFPLRWDAEKFRKALLAAIGPEIFDLYASRIQPEIAMPITTVLLNKNIALMGVPGEPFVEFQSNWRDRCPVQDAFFTGYTNGYYGYFPTIKAAAQGGYGAASFTTWVEPGAGERMVEHAIVRVYEMLGKLDRMPEDLKNK